MNNMSSEGRVLVELLSICLESRQSHTIWKKNKQNQSQNNHSIESNRIESNQMKM